MLKLSEDDVGTLVDMQAALEAVERGLTIEAARQAETLQKHVLPYGGGAQALHVLGAVAPGLGLSGVKTWVQAGATAQPMLILFDSLTARPLAMIEANVLSNLRTGALAGVATKYLAAADADTLGVIGSGKQATTMIRAVCAVRPLRHVRIWSPSQANREAMAEKMAQELDVPVVAAGSAEEALADAAIVGLAARAPSPVVRSTMIARGAHVNSIGTTVSGKSELPQEIFPRFATICADSVASVRSLSDEFRTRYATERDWEAVLRLADVVAAAAPRRADADLTLYKGMGTGIADLALGAALLVRAKARGDDIDLPEALSG